MQQNTDNWLLWRHKGLGSSDAAIVMGVHPDKTPFQLWEEKILPEPPKQEKNFIFEKGHRLEKKARADFELKMGLEFSATTGEREDYKFIKVSLDGWNADSNRGLEIKYVGKDYFENTNKFEDIKPDHYCQMMHQFLVTNAKSIYYCLYNDKIDKTKIIEVKPDEKYCAELLLKECSFWDLVTSKTAPELTDKDWKVIKNKELAKVLMYRDCFVEQVKSIEALIKLCDIDIKAIFKKGRGICDGYKMEYIMTKGRIDYKKIPIVKQMSEGAFEKFRTKPSKRFKITPPKDQESQPSSSSQ